MNDDPNTIQETEEEETFDVIPPEVQNYVYSDDFDNSFNTLCSDVAITLENKTLLKGALFNFIAQMDDGTALRKRVESVTADPIQQQKIREWIDTNLYKKILDLVSEAYVWNEEHENEEESIPGTSNETKTAPVSLATLSERLKQASITATVRRDYTPLTSTESAPIKKSSDPYHEAIGD